MNAPVKLEVGTSVVDLHEAAQRVAVEDYVTAHGGSLFHMPQWLSAVEAGTGQKAAGFIARRGDSITGWLPLTEARSMLFGKALVSSGFGVGGGILSHDRDSRVALASAVKQYALSNGFASIELRGGEVPDGWRSIRDKHTGFEQALAADGEAQLLAIPRKARAEIRKGLKNDLTVRIGRTDRDLADHYALYSESVRNLGTPVFPRALFAQMLKAFPDADILTVSSTRGALASVLSFYHKGAVMPFWGGGSFAARNARANEVMYYSLMCHAREKGMQRFDFGRSKTGSGPYNFKKNWGFEPEPLTYGQWNAPGKQLRDIDPTSASYARKIALWKKLPLPVANAIGPVVARGLA